MSSLTVSGGIGIISIKWSKWTRIKDGTGTKCAIGDCTLFTMSLTHNKCSHANLTSARWPAPVSLILLPARLRDSSFSFCRVRLPSAEPMRSAPTSVIPLYRSDRCCTLHNAMYLLVFTTLLLLIICLSTLADCTCTAEWLLTAHSMHTRKISHVWGLTVDSSLTLMQLQSHMTQKLGWIAKIRPNQI